MKSRPMKKTPLRPLLALAGFSATTFAQQSARITPVPRTEVEGKWVSNHESRVARAKQGPQRHSRLANHFPSARRPQPH
jgi:hypothetical protein